MDRNSLQDIVPATLTFGEVNKIHGLGILPILNDGVPTIIPPLETLDEALDKGTITIREINEEGAVPFLHVENRGERAVLILDGEELVGGRQNRIINSTVIVLAHHSIRAAVSCIQQGRWSYNSREFSSGKSIFRASSRAIHNQSVTASLRREGTPSSNQGAVWDQVQRTLSELGVQSRTADFEDARRNLRVAHRIDEFVDGIRPVRNQTGAIFFDHLGVIGAEVLTTSDLFTKSLGKIVRSFALDVLTVPPLNGVNIDPVKQWWNDALEIKFSKHRSIGVGEDIRVEGTNIIGSGLVYAGEMIHFSAFQLAGRQSEKSHRNTNRSSARDRRKSLRSSIIDD